MPWQALMVASSRVQVVAMAASESLTTVAPLEVIPLVELSQPSTVLVDCNQSVALSTQSAFEQLAHSCEETILAHYLRGEVCRLD